MQHHRSHAPAWERKTLPLQRLLISLAAASPEEDEDFDFEATVRGIRVELADLNKETTDPDSDQLGVVGI